jgi:spermidine/putrescine transport system ATP-binding protein
MNGGRIEQLGGPGELYESPATTFVANFLGQSNLIRTAVTGAAGEDLLLDVHGNRLAMPASRRRSGETDLLIGIRPEKIHLAVSGAAPAGRETNVLPDGVVTDASFTGVSTQYLVRMPWGQELMVFAQNKGTGVMAPGSTVDLQWDPAHTFGLDGSGDVHAGVEHDEDSDPIPVG